MRECDRWKFKSLFAAATEPQQNKTKKIAKQVTTHLVTPSSANYPTLGSITLGTTIYFLVHLV